MVEAGLVKIFIQRRPGEWDRPTSSKFPETGDRLWLPVECLIEDDGLSSRNNKVMAGQTTATRGRCAVCSMHDLWDRVRSTNGPCNEGSSIEDVVHAGIKLLTGS